MGKNLMHARVDLIDFEYTKLFFCQDTLLRNVCPRLFRPNDRLIGVIELYHWLESLVDDDSWAYVFPCSIQ